MKNYTINEPEQAKMHASFGLEVKEYVAPAFDAVELEASDIITTSPGTETTPKDETDGVWDLDFGTAKIQ